MRRLPRIGWLVMLLVIALATLGIGWTLWFEELTINSTVSTGRVSAGFVNAFTDDDDVVDDAARDSGDTDECPDFGGVDVDGDGLTSCDPAAPGPDPKDRYDKDVARCDASIAPNDSSVAHVVKRNVYPSYHCTAWFDVRNDGTIPVKIAQATINGAQLQPGSPTPMDLDGDGAADVEVEIPALELCLQIDPGDTFSLEVRQHILQSAPQGEVLQYVVKVQLNQWNEPCPPPVPVLEVVSTGVSSEAAAVLAEALGLPTTDILQPDGSLLFVDETRYQALPTVPGESGPEDEGGQETAAEAFDFDAIRQIVPYDQKAALARVQDAFAQAGILDPTGAVAPMFGAGHSRFEWEMNGRTETAMIDTHVDAAFVFEPNGLPLVGPGAQVKVAFDPSGEVSLLHVAIAQLRPAEFVEIIPPGEAQKQCADRYGDLGFQGSEVNLAPAREVYLKFELENVGIVDIHPHYQCGGTALVEGEEILLRPFYVPAIAEGAPQVALEVTVDGTLVSAQATVEGGTPPYSFEWTSAHLGALPSDTDTAEYDLATRTDTLPAIEDLSVQVTDTNGLTDTASETFEVSSPILLNAAGHQSVGPVDVGTEWIGTCGGLSGSSANAGGFVSTFQAEGIPVEFNWGNFSAWEQDFKDPSKGGDDSDWVDNVDAVFYTGHANGNGLGNFCSSVDDTFVRYDDAVWGNRDLEWLVVAACGPLQLESAGLQWWQRWGPAFKGLHILMGYANVSFDNTTEGRDFAQVALGRGFPWGLFGPQKVRVAWSVAAFNSQGPSVIHSYMGAIGSGGVTNYNDYFWGKGPVGPDIINPVGYWALYSTS